MFKFLKDKLKGVVDSIKKGIEDEVETEEVEVEEVVETKVEKKPAKKEVKKEDKKIENKTEKKEKKKESSKSAKQEKTVSKPKKETIKGVKITYFVHGTTTDNEQKLATGWAQGELSELGITQAKELGILVKDKTFDVVFCSDLKRAIDSANFGFKDKYEIIQDERIREADYGDFTEKPADDFKSDVKDYVNKPFPKGESYLHVEQRIAKFLNYLLKNYKGKHVAIVAHQAPQLAIEVLLDNKSWDQAIGDDWRPKKKWQAGWEYSIEKEVEVIPEDNLPKEEKKGFLKRLFGKNEEVKTEDKDEAESDVKESDDELVEEKVEAESKLKEDIKSESEKVEVENSRSEVEPKSEPKTEPEVEEPVEEKKGFFKRLTETITKFNLSESKFEDLFWELELTLLENNVAVEVIEKIKGDLKEELCTGKVSRKGIEAVIKDSLRNSIAEVLEVETFDFDKKITEKKPYIIAFIGVNGSGKTTNMAKIAKRIQDSGKSIVFAAADTFRAAAIQQLEAHTTRLGVKLIKHDYNADPSAVAFDAVKHATAKNLDVVLIDTAGRLQSNTNLMDELKKLVRINKPDMNLFVGESITGNDCVEQAVAFNEAVGIDAIILSKADVDDKGGAAISVSYVSRKPILFLGTGQTDEDLTPYKKELILDALGL